MTCISSDPCVCVQTSREMSGGTRPANRESPDGGVCDLTRTLIHWFRVSSSSSRVRQSASSSVSTNRESTSTLLALCRVVDNV